MALLDFPSLARWAAALRAMLRGSILDRPLGRIPDRDIDRALETRGQTRADLFTAAGAGARHRVRMARMIAAHRIDVRRAVRVHWRLLKTADNYCSHCPAPERCKFWLDRGVHDGTEPKRFCPNARLFSDIAARQKAPGQATVPAWPQLDDAGARPR
jgi:hypothetical protein